MNSRGRKPGDYPSAGPLAHLIDFWNAGAPSIDFLAPDIYDTGFRMWAGRYAIPARPQDGGVVRNRLFIPETRCCRDCGVRAHFGRHRRRHHHLSGGGSSAVRAAEAGPGADRFPAAQVHHHGYGYGAQ